ncbi:MAG: hypothetical protein WC437_04980 [Patescibacteria group bacterium]|jgi:hypothetical protein
MPTTKQKIGVLKVTPKEKIEVYLDNAQPYLVHTIFKRPHKQYPDIPQFRAFLTANWARIKFSEGGQDVAQE